MLSDVLHEADRAREEAGAPPMTLDEARDLAAYRRIRGLLRPRARRSAGGTAVAGRASPASSTLVDFAVMPWSQLALGRGVAADVFDDRVAQPGRFPDDDRRDRWPTAVGRRWTGGGRGARRRQDQRGGQGGRRRHRHRAVPGGPGGDHGLSDGELPGGAVPACGGRSGCSTIDPADGGAHRRRAGRAAPRSMGARAVPDRPGGAGRRGAGDGRARPGVRRWTRAASGSWARRSTRRWWAC